MPAQYEAVRDSEYQRLLKKGVKPAAAMKQAKRIAAGYWNKHNPGNPIGPHREPKAK